MKVLSLLDVLVCLGFALLAIPQLCLVGSSTVRPGKSTLTNLRYPRKRPARCFYRARDAIAAVCDRSGRAVEHVGYCRPTL